MNTAALQPADASMTRVRKDQPLVPSVLDRLIDEQPEQQREAAKGRGQLLTDVRNSIRRDLENLLNTRFRCLSWPDDLTELEQSLASYGIPDVAGANLASESGRRQFLKIVEQTIRNFEPRFKSVRVEFLDNADELDRTMRFRIDAMMYAYPAPEPIVFDTAMEPATGEFSVVGGER
jgi:type VI secretion system protein ImpF